jgi:hypothetical protein
VINTPELDKQHAVIESGEADTLTRFVDWLRDEKEFVIAEWVKYDEYEDTKLTPIHARIEELFAEFFGIDLNKIEQERRAILEELRESR